MDDCFCIKGKDECGQLCYIDIPDGKCEEGVQVIGSQHSHGGDNQQWMWYNDQIVSLMLCPLYSLSVKDIEEGSPVTLHYEDIKDCSDTYFNKWIFDNGILRLKADGNYTIGLSNGNIVLKATSENNLIQWEIQSPNCYSKPAATCHLNYRPIANFDISDSWILENSVCVRKSSDSTYFCVIGWGPGGCAGIQQIDESHKLVIFSMMSRDGHSIKVLEIGEGVHVSALVGEGAGMKAIKDIDWEIDQIITFRVISKKYSDDYVSSWRCSCFFSIDNGNFTAIASYEMSGGKPPFDHHTYAFIEDLDRRYYNFEGHTYLRMAEFSNAMCIHNQETIHFNRAVFTKQKHGSSKVALRKAFCGVGEGSTCFLLSTGGYSETAIWRYLILEKYGQCTNKHLSNMTL